MSRKESILLSCPPSKRIVSCNLLEILVFTQIKSAVLVVPLILGSVVETADSTAALLHPAL